MQGAMATNDNEYEETDYSPYIYEQNQQILKELKWQSQVLQNIHVAAERTSASAQNLWRLSFLALQIFVFCVLMGLGSIVPIVGHAVALVVFCIFLVVCRHVFRAKVGMPGKK